MRINKIFSITKDGLNSLEEYFQRTWEYCRRNQLSEKLDLHCSIQGGDPNLAVQFAHMLAAEVESLKVYNAASAGMRMLLYFPQKMISLYEYGEFMLHAPSVEGNLTEQDQQLNIYRMRLIKQHEKRLLRVRGCNNKGFMDAWNSSRPELMSAEDLVSLGFAASMFNEKQQTVQVPPPPAKEKDFSEEERIFKKALAAEDLLAQQAASIERAESLKQPEGERSLAQSDREEMGF